MVDVAERPGVAVIRPANKLPNANKLSRHGCSCTPSDALVFLYLSSAMADAPVCTGGFPVADAIQPRAAYAPAPP